MTTLIALIFMLFEVGVVINVYLDWRISTLKLTIRNLTMSNITKKAQEQINLVLIQAGDPNAPITLIGHPRKTETDYTRDETFSNPIKAQCDTCGADVWSSELKVEIRRLHANSELLCVECLRVMMHQHAEQHGEAPQLFQAYDNSNNNNKDTKYA